jgi:glycerol-3-phosphate dehydrogenase (NAD(P)+)
MAEILKDLFPAAAKKIGVLSGPQFADEVASGLKTGSLIAFYLEESRDVTGAEIAGAGKNAVSLVFGYYKVRAPGRNEVALMISRAWSEVINIGVALGGKAQTFSGLAGVGDLFLSAANGGGRNYAAGVAIARREPIVGTVEGIDAVKGLVHIAAAHGVDVPSLSAMAKLLR